MLKYLGSAALSCVAVAAGAQSRPTTPPPSPAPPVVFTPSPPPVVRMPQSLPPMAPTSELPRSTLDVRLSSDSGILYEGILRVGPRSEARVSMDRREAAAESCPSDRYENQSVHTNFNLSISPRVTERSSDAFAVSVSWTRAATTDGCAEGGSRTAGFQQQVELAVGEEKSLRGDGGLMLRIRRR
jgi:hypothetical protein